MDAADAAAEDLSSAAHARMVQRGGVQHGTYPMMWSPDQYDSAGPWFLGTKAIVGNRTDDKVKKHLQEHAGREWWRGKAKGMLQILFERGHIDPKDAAGNKHWQAEWGTVNKKKYEPTDEDVKQKRKKSADGSYGGKKIASATLAAMEDYLGEVSIIENVFLEKGHLLQASPRYHPAMALSTPGLEFRRHINDLQAKNLTENILIALGDQPYTVATSLGEQEYPAPLLLERCRRFARRARTNRLLFEHMPTKEAAEELLKGWKAGTLVLQGIDMPKAPKATVDVHALIDAMYPRRENARTARCPSLCATTRAAQTTTSERISL